MKNIKMKMLEVVLEQIDILKKSNNDFQLEIKKLKSKIEELENPINNPGNRVEAMQKKLDYYEKYFTDSLIWVKPGEKEPDTNSLYLAKVLMNSAGELRYYIIKYNDRAMKWINYSEYCILQQDIIEFAELPVINKGRNYGK